MLLGVTGMGAGCVLQAGQQELPYGSHILDGNVVGVLQRLLSGHSAAFALWSRQATRPC